jgi:hypothetical protein
MLDPTGVNWVAVVVAAVANIIISAVWYLPAVFGKRWAALTGREAGMNPNPMLYVVAIIGALVSAWVLDLIAKGVGAHDAQGGIAVGLFCWLGFQAANTAVGGAFEGRSWFLWAINAGNAALGFAVMGAIIGAMG